MKINLNDLKSSLGIPYNIPKGMNKEWDRIECFGYTQLKNFFHDNQNEVKPSLALVTRVKVLPSFKKGLIGQHRIQIICPLCRRMIPAGRWHQHEPCHTNYCVKNNIPIR